MHTHGRPTLQCGLVLLSAARLVRFSLESNLANPPSESMIRIVSEIDDALEARGSILLSYQDIG
ncbi:MAG: hypothetical protein O7C65_05185 [Planctomycetota bacterium]|nr:hypothetical protein [Planctomycetota bacterium]MCZ6735165.1 hypothetical protein [Planctomycetota bacterium]